MLPQIILLTSLEIAPGTPPPVNSLTRCTSGSRPIFSSACTWEAACGCWASARGTTRESKSAQDSLSGNEAGSIPRSLAIAPAAAPCRGPSMKNAAPVSGLLPGGFGNISGFDGFRGAENCEALHSVPCVVVAPPADGTTIATATIPAATAADSALNNLALLVFSRSRPSPWPPRPPNAAVSNPTDWTRRRLHFVGIGGAGMSGLALIARALGASVTGSDRAESSYIARLRAHGIEPVIGHAAANVPAGAEVVYSSAVAPENPERQAAAAPELHRADLMAEIAALRRCLAVTGTHGKTTTAGMIVHVLRACGMDPSYLIGGELCETDSNAGWGTGEWIVVEADESDRSL